MKGKAGEKKLSVHPWTKKVNPNFYEDCTLTPRGERIIDEMGKKLRQSLLKKGVLQTV